MGSTTSVPAGPSTVSELSTTTIPDLSTPDSPKQSTKPSTTLSPAAQRLLTDLETTNKPTSRTREELIAASSAKTARHQTQAFFIPTTTINSATIPIQRRTALETIAPEILDMIFAYLSDLNDRIMLALASKTLALQFNYHESTARLWSPASLHTSPRVARVNKWVAPSKKYCRLCGVVKDIEVKRWAKIAYDISMKNRKRCARYHYLNVEKKGLERLTAKNVLKWISNEEVEEEPQRRLKQIVLRSVPKDTWGDVKWGAVCPLHEVL